MIDAIRKKDEKMPTVFVAVDGVIHRADVCHDTHEYLRDGALLRGRPLQWFLWRIVKKYGALTEETITKFMDEEWIL